MLQSVVFCRCYSRWVYIGVIAYATEGGSVMLNQMLQNVDVHICAIVNITVSGVLWCYSRWVHITLTAAVTGRRVHIGVVADATEDGCISLLVYYSRCYSRWVFCCVEPDVTVGGCTLVLLQMLQKLGAWWCYSIIMLHLKSVQWCYIRCLFCGVTEDSTVGGCTLVWQQMNV